MELFSLWTQILLLLMGSTILVNADCVDGWVQLRSGRYMFVCEKEVYSDALAICNENGGSLVSINTLKEAEVLIKKLMEIITSVEQGTWWVGLSFDIDKETWIWTDRTSYDDSTMSLWAPGEPNNGLAEEDCAELSFEGKLNDESCLSAKPFICEKMKIVISSDNRTTHSHTSKSSTHHHQDFSFSTSRKTPFINGDYSTFETTIDSMGGQVCSYASGKVVEVSEDGFCPEQTLLNVKWPRTAAGQHAMMPCPSGSNMAFRKCNSYPVCWEENHNIQNCTSRQIRDFLSKATSELSKGTNKAKVVVSQKLADVTSQPKMSVEDYVVASKFFKSFSNSLDFSSKPKKETVESIVTDVVKIGNNLMSKDQTKAFNNMTKHEVVESASELMSSVDSATMKLVNAIDEPQLIVKKTENIEAQLQVLDVDKLEEPEITFHSEGDSFALPSENLRSISKGGLAKVVFVTYNSLPDLMPTIETDTAEGQKEVKIYSKIISASVANYHGEVLREPVEFSMEHTKPLPIHVKPRCSFWNMTANTRPYWSQKGCRMINSDIYQTKCRCNHLTNFAILMDVEGIEISYTHQNALRIITYVGCSISMIGLFLSWITFNVVTAIRGERNSIHKNLVFCLFVAQLLFMIGVDRTTNKMVCSVFAGLMHYFFLAAFSWMLMEAAKILIMIVQVFKTAKSKMIYYYIFGYGFPTLVVSISAIVNLDGYGTDRHCWLSTEDYFVWAFNGPVAFVLLVNAIILTYALITIYQHSGYVIPDDMVGTIGAWVKGALSLEVILGLTWVFGFFYMNEATLVIAYIFAILNSLQGFFIYCFHCLGNKQVWKEYKRLLKVKEKSTSGTSTKTASVTRKPTDAANYEMAAPNHNKQ
ncbi:adhesion G protein-coupled receptor L3 isoform X1 [Octopus sinensis]|uniref:Adhesion G protein-coupled receptor L3 isoform X1 n=1 Tax=Octopus sinensis TaxID=2607531 RepID=A0A7E6F0S1_9MOLL|nr:adhesion G protein-coupled receptor L3 isoform X1 [Octopus sinensis]XP_036361148.1 adhesion G protein-coupled receptor L3 isoform X1 [Octopus sinensis]